MCFWLRRPGLRPGPRIGGLNISLLHTPELILNEVGHEMATEFRSLSLSNLNLSHQCDG